MKGKALRKHSLHEKTAASVLKLCGFIEIKYSYSKERHLLRRANSCRNVKTSLIQKIDTLFTRLRQKS